MGVRLCLIVVLIGIYLIINDAEHLLKCLLAIVYFLWRNVYASPLAILKSGLVFCCLVVEALYIFSILTLYQRWFANIFSYSIYCLYTVGGVISCTEVFNFDEFSLSYFFFCCLCFWCHAQEIISKSNVIKLSLYVLGLTVGYLIHFELFFCICC